MIIYGKQIYLISVHRREVLSAQVVILIHPS